MFGHPAAEPSAADQRRITVDRTGSRTRPARTVTPDDLRQLRLFVRLHHGDVELFLEPATIATDTTVLAVADNGEWIRRRVGGPAIAWVLGRELAVPVYNVTRVGYPAVIHRHHH
ncbi:oxidoreductase [Nocardia sp. NPDC004278]